MEPKEVAAAVVITINKAIHETEEGAQKKADSRMPSSSGASGMKPKVTPTVSVNVEAFDRFLDAIWPADVARQ